MISLVNDLNTEINNLFNRFSEVPSVTKEWVGQQAQFYFRIGYKLSTDVFEMNTCINKNINEESK